MESKQIQKSLQFLLWMWFGTMTSFVCVSVVNIAKLETQVNNLNHELDDLQKRHLLLKYNTIQK